MHEPVNLFNISSSIQSTIKKNLSPLGFNMNNPIYKNGCVNCSLLHHFV